MAEWPNTETTFDELEVAYRELRVGLTKVTAERDAALADEKLYIANVTKLEEEGERWLTELQEAQTALDSERRAHAETKAALEAAEAVASRLRERENTVADQVEASHAAYVRAVQAERDTARAELRTLTEAWALRERDRLARNFRGDQPAVHALPSAVAALIRAGAGKPIGECDRCGKRAPLAETYGDCCPGWGCSAEKGGNNGE